MHTRRVLTNAGLIRRPHLSLAHSCLLSLCPPLLSSAAALLAAYQLRVCQPPPEVPNADMLMEDGELEIGEFLTR